MTLPFPGLVQLLYDEASVSEIPRVDERVKVIATSQTGMIKDLAYLELPMRPYAPNIVPPTTFEGPSIPTESIAT